MGKPCARAHRPTVIFDGDDTLGDAMSLRLGKAGMARLLLKTVPERDALIKEFEDVPMALR
jgi:hypothetical protein